MTVNVKETIIQPEATENMVARQAEVDKSGRSYATGKRKNSIAKVWLKKGTGKITVNQIDVARYLKRTILVTIVNQPFEVTNTIGQFDVICSVKGGGLSGQGGAIRHGIAVALQKFNPIYRGTLKKEGLLTRDPRVVERKKPGRKKARKGRTYKKR